MKQLRHVFFYLEQEFRLLESVQTKYKRNKGLKLYSNKDNLFHCYYAKTGFCDLRMNSLNKKP